MAVNLQMNDNDNADKRLALIKIVKVDLTKENDNENNDESTTVYSPAYISTISTCTVNNGTVSQEVQFKFLGNIGRLGSILLVVHKIN